MVCVGLVLVASGCANVASTPVTTVTATVHVTSSSKPSSSTSVAASTSMAASSVAASSASVSRAKSPSVSASSSVKAEGVDLTNSFKQLQNDVGGSIGLAYVPLHSTKTPVSLGQYLSDVAWSTSKVPVAVAALRADKSSATLSNVTLAIEQSDNSAAERMWGVLGSNSAASAATEKVLAEGGNSSVQVPTTRLRAGYTVFGQTQWSLAQQATFVSNLSCLNQGSKVLNLMGQVTPDQRWGLGRLNSEFKGGWGPNSGGSYLARQLGVVHLSDGDLAVAIMARPGDGSFGSATAALDQIAAWIPKHLHGARTTACS